VPAGALPAASTRCQTSRGAGATRVALPSEAPPQSSPASQVHVARASPAPFPAAGTNGETLLEIVSRIDTYADDITGDTSMDA